MSESFSFQDNLARMLDYIRNAAGSNTVILEQSMLYILLAAIAAGQERLAMKDEYLTRENSWAHAQNLSTLMGEVEFRGYKPKRAQGAVGQLLVFVNQDMAKAPIWGEFVTYAIADKVIYETMIEGVTSYKLFTSLQNNNEGYVPDDPGSAAYWQMVDCFPTSKISIPEWSQFTGGAYTYTSTAAEQLLTTEDYKVISVVQGTPINKKFTGVGVDFESFTITDENIDNTFYNVKVNGEKYTEVDNILEASKDQKVFQLLTLKDYAGIRVVFGNSTFGRKIQTGDIIRVEYSITDSFPGEVYRSDVVTTVDSSFVAEDGVTPVPLYCRNLSPITGAKINDTKEDIRSGGLASYQTQNRAITQADYQYLLDFHALVGKSVVWGAYEDYKGSATNPAEIWDVVKENAINISAYTPSEQQLTTAEKEVLLQYLYSKKSPNDFIKFQDVQFVYLSFDIDAVVTDTAYALGETRTAIIEALAEKYKADNFSFKESLYETKWKGFISSIPGVDHHTSILSLAAKTSFSSTGVINVKLPFIPIEKSTFEIWVKDISVETSSPIKVLWTETEDGNPVWHKHASIHWTDETLPETEIMDLSALEPDIINLTTGEVFGLKVASNTTLFGTQFVPANWAVYIYYRPETRDGNMDYVLTERNQIFKFLDVRNITVSYGES